MVIGFVQTSLTVSETDGSVTLEIRLMEGVIAPQLGDIVVTASSSDQTATGGYYVGVSSFHIAIMYVGCEKISTCGLTILEHKLATTYMHVLAVKH